MVSVPAPPFLENDVSQRRYLWVAYFCAQSQGHETTGKRVMICLLLSIVRASNGGGKACHFNNVVDHLL